VAGATAAPHCARSGVEAVKIESILLTTVRIQTFRGHRPMTNATGFFFERGAQLFLVTCRHVLVDAYSDHHPDRIEIELHVGDDPLSTWTCYSIPLFERGLSVWRTCADVAGDVDVAAVEITRDALPRNANYRAFTQRHLTGQPESIEVGQPILVVGYPLGFQDNTHRLPVVRQATIASSYGLRFQGQGYFLTDARTHRGTSGAPVVMRVADDPSAGAPPGTTHLPWLLLGVHSARLDVGTRDLVLDEALGLNCAWYADVLTTLIDARPG
jgi:Trypsin-like peptidase domain